MKLSDITCPDFKLTTEDGKTRCLHILPSGGCDLFDRCSEWYKAKGLADEKTYSNSRISSFRSCERSYYYQYIEKIVAVEKAMPLKMGIGGHRMLANLYRGRPFETLQIDGFDMTIEKDAIEVHRLSAILEAYWKIMSSEDLQTLSYTMKDVEVFKEQKLFDRTLIGYLDLRPKYKGKQAIFDHKIRGELEKSIVADMDQIQMYFFLDPEAEQFVLNVLTKPWRMRLKKNEELEEFRKRIFTEMMAYPKKYFKRTYYYRGEFDLETWKKEIQITIEELEGKPKEIEFYPRDPKACYTFGCDYMSICETGIIDENLFKKKGVR